MKVLYGIFPNCNGVVAKIPSKKTECVTKGVYMHKILSDVQKHYKIRRPNSGGIKLLLNNAPVHSSKYTYDYLFAN